LTSAVDGDKSPEEESSVKSQNTANTNIPQSLDNAQHNYCHIETTPVA